jgi:hypothetical protein
VLVDVWVLEDGSTLDDPPLIDTFAPFLDNGPAGVELIVDKDEASLTVNTGEKDRAVAVRLRSIQDGNVGNIARFQP